MSTFRYCNKNWMVGAAVALGLALASGHAVAAECTDTTKGNNEAAKAEIHISNGTSATLSVTYYRNATSKKTESVVPGGSSDFTADFSSNNETATLKAVVAAQGSYTQTTCQYTVTNSHTDESSGGQKNSTAFSNAGCSTSDDGTAYNFTCDRSWGGGKSRWKGSFALAD